MTDYNPGPATTDTPNISNEQIFDGNYLSTNLPPASSALPGTIIYTTDLGLMVSSGTAWASLVASGTPGSAGVAKTGAATYAAARLLTGTATGDTLYVFGRTTQSDGGQGLFTWVAGGSTSVNDGFELTATGGIWRRAGIFLLDPSMLGLASFTFATLPTPTQMVNMPSGIEAFSTDQGLNIWNGTVWSAVGGGPLSGRVAFALAAGATNNLNPAGGFPTNIGRLILTAPSGVANITGLLAGADNQYVSILNNDSTNNITLNKLNGGSSAANQFTYASDLILPPGGTVLAIYDLPSTKWILR